LRIWMLCNDWVGHPSCRWDSQRRFWRFHPRIGSEKSHGARITPAELLGCILSPTYPRKGMASYWSCSNLGFHKGVVCVTSVGWNNSHFFVDISVYIVISCYIIYPYWWVLPYSCKN
jgi:hypothetical protein